MSDRPMHTVPGLYARLEALYAEGEQAIAEGRYEDAVARFSEGIALDDHFRQRWITQYAQRAFALHRLGRWEEALADYEAALKMGEPPPNQAQYHFHRGMVLERLDRPEEAATAYGEAIAMMPEQPGPRHLRGQLLAEKLGRPAEALLDFDAFLAAGYENPAVRVLRAWCLLLAGRPAEALQDLARVPDPAAWTCYLRAWACAVTGDVDGCLGAIAETLAQDGAYRPYFLEHPDYAAARADPRFEGVLSGQPS